MTTIPSHVPCVGTTRIGTSTFSLARHQSWRKQAPWIIGLCCVLAVTLVFFDSRLGWYTAMLLTIPIALACFALAPNRIHYGEQFWKQIPIAEYQVGLTYEPDHLTNTEKMYIRKHISHLNKEGHNQIVVMVQTRTDIKTGDTWDAVLGPIQATLPRSE